MQTMVPVCRDRCVTVNLVVRARRPAACLDAHPKRFGCAYTLTSMPRQLQVQKFRLMLLLLPAFRSPCESSSHQTTAGTKPTLLVMISERNYSVFGGERFNNNSDGLPGLVAAFCNAAILNEFAAQVLLHSAHLSARTFSPNLPECIW